MLHLALKAFGPGRLPFPVMHVDTGHNFDEVLAVRDELVAETGVRLVVAKVQDDIDAGRVVETIPSRNPMQTFTLLRAIRENKFDAAFGGARRDEEKARAKERVFSFRDEFGQWDPKSSAPSCGTSTTAGTTRASTSGCSRCPTGPSSTSGPTSAPRRSRCRRSTTPTSARCSSATACCWPCTAPAAAQGRDGVEKTVRFRTVGDVTCTGCVESRAGTRVRGHRRDRGVAADRTRRDPRRRPHLRSRDGRPQARGVLLTWRPVAADRDRRFGRRRQVHADRQAALRLQGRHGGPAGARWRRTSKERGHDYTDLALVTDGLRAEREQGITIDVAYRYFATAKRKFIIADTPGHIQYTRNMVTGRRPRSWHRPGRRAPRAAGAVPPARVPGLAAGHPAHRARGQQDGPRRLGSGAVRKDPRRLPRIRRPARRARRDDHPAVGAQRRQRGHQVRRHALVRGPGAAEPPRRGLHRR